VKRIIAVTLGEAAGVGPEVAVKAAVSPAARHVCAPLLVGPLAVAREALRVAGGAGGAELRAIGEVADFDEEFPGLQVLDTRTLESGEWERGRMSAACGRAAAADTELAAGLAMRGAVHALVSGPINKQAFDMAGYKYLGQTDLLQKIVGVGPVLTILAGGGMRVALLSSHVSLRRAIELARRERIAQTARKLYEALREAFGILDPVIGIAGINPHSGDGGLLGNEEIEEIAPAVEELRRSGIRVTGPVPPDAFFLQGEKGRYDGMLAMYHDQGVVPLKRHAYATFAYGLPFIRTTAGHGTAYDIAGTGAADPSAMRNALLLAASLADSRRRNRA
jgi:4-hydroxythreonine-4-phosphate dehydrogenase